MYEKSHSTIVCIVLLLNERSFNIIDFIAGQKAKELEASVLIGKCNSPHHFEAVTLQEVGIHNTN